MKMKTTVLAALSAVMFAGCVSEQERQAIAAAEKERQEQIAAKEREEARLRRQKTVDEINSSTNQYFVLDVMKNGQDEELRELAKSRLRDITLQMISMSSNITMLALISDSSAHEKSRQEITAKISKEKEAHETAVNRFFRKIDAHIDQCITHNGFLSREWIQWEEWKSIAPDIQNDINAKLDEFSQFVQSAKQTTKGMYLDVWAERGWIKSHDKTWYASVETFKRKAISSLPNNKLVNELDLNTAKYEMPEVRTAAQRRIEEVRKTSGPAEIEEHYQNLAEHNYNLLLNVLHPSNPLGSESHIIECYKKYVDKFNKTKPRDYIETKPWQKLVGNRLPISEKESLEGRAKLDAFGTRFLPMAYASYEKIRDNAIEVQQMFNEEFPEPRKITTSSSGWNAYTNLLHGLMKARTQYLRRHDELCHFYLMHKIGALSEERLFEIDNKTISLRLYEEDPGYFRRKIKIEYSRHTITNEAIAAFASKYAADTYSIYQTCKSELLETQRLFNEVLADVRIMDITRFELSVVACYEKIIHLTRALDSLSADIKAWHIEYKTLSKDASAIAKLDQIQAHKWKDFVGMLPGYLKSRANGPLINASSAMNKYNQCNIVRDWHWNAIGFQFTDKRQGLEQNDEPNIQIGRKLDQPTFIKDIPPKLFIKYHDIGGNLRPAALCTEFFPDKEIILENIKYPYRLLIAHNAVTRHMNEVAKCGWISIHGKDDATESANGFPDDSAFLNRLNEIDTGKTTYYGLKLMSTPQDNPYRQTQYLTIKNK